MRSTDSMDDMKIICARVSVRRVARATAALGALLFLAACSHQPPVIDEDMMHVTGPLPADFSGSWERNYARDDEVGRVLQQAYYQLSRTSGDRAYNSQGFGPTQKDADAVLALARLAELITRPDVLTITQNDNEISIERKDDYAMFCAFYNGVAKAEESGFGTEVCGWDGDQLVSHLVLPDGLQITHRFTMSEDKQQLRVVTTVASKTSKVPFTLRRFYNKFEKLPSEFHCIETLSMKRVCSTRALSE